jgi:hypothetical protein
MSRPTISAEGAEGQVVLRLGRDYWQMPATEAYDLGLAILRAVAEADGVIRPRGYTEGAIVTTDLSGIVSRDADGASAGGPSLDVK